METTHMDGLRIKSLMWPRLKGLKYTAVNRLIGDLVEKGLAFFIPKGDAISALNFVDETSLVIVSAKFFRKKDFVGVNMLNKVTQKRSSRIYICLKWILKSIHSSVFSIWRCKFILRWSDWRLSFSSIVAWTWTPAAFHIVSRALVYELNQFLTNFVIRYTDSICGGRLSRTWLCCTD